MLATTIFALGFVSTPLLVDQTDWAVLAPISHMNLAIYPVVDKSKLAVGDRYISLDEGLKKGTITIMEMSGGGTPLIRNRNGQQAANVPANRQNAGAEVNNLSIVNASGKILVLMAGEMVVGGKQDRIVQKDGLIPSSKQPTSLEVFCVEHGRWSSTDHVSFKPTDNSIVAGAGGAVADPTVRGAAQASKSQGSVWAKVDEKNRKSGIDGESQTYQRTLNSDKNKRNSADYIKAIMAKFPKKGAVGVIVSVNGRLIWADCFADESLFQRYQGKLLSSYVVEAVTEFLPATAYDHPTASKALAFLNDDSGASTFEGAKNVYKLTRTEGRNHLIHDLSDESVKDGLTIHFNKMLRL